MMQRLDVGSPACGGPEEGPSARPPLPEPFLRPAVAVGERPVARHVRAAQNPDRQFPFVQKRQADSVLSFADEAARAVDRVEHPVPALPAPGRVSKVDERKDVFGRERRRQMAVAVAVAVAVATGNQLLVPQHLVDQLRDPPRHRGPVLGRVAQIGRVLLRDHGEAGRG